MPNPLNVIEIILVEPSHPGNIGAVARAMKNMGFQRLTLVKPKYFPHPDADARAAGADDVLQQARVVETVEEALKTAELVVGTSARVRSLAWPTKTVRHWVDSLTNIPLPRSIAVVFGAERMGLTNEQLQKCHCHIQIPADPEFNSLNLASAVQLVCYELRQGLLNVSLESIDASSIKANNGELEGLFQHLEQILYDIEFINPKQPKQLMPRLRRLFLRAEPDKQEVNILRGILTAIEKLVLTR
jgi:tRNA (cytidine32/uridine32-2'-O)-methyltransferase